MLNNELETLLTDLTAAASLRGKLEVVQRVEHDPTATAASERETANARIIELQTAIRALFAGAGAT